MTVTMEQTCQIILIASVWSLIQSTFHVPRPHQEKARRHSTHMHTNIYNAQLNYTQIFWQKKQFKKTIQSYQSEWKTVCIFLPMSKRQFKQFKLSSPFDVYKIETFNANQLSLHNLWHDFIVNAILQFYFCFLFSLITLTFLLSLISHIFLTF